MFIGDRPHGGYDDDGDDGDFVYLITLMTLAWHSASCGNFGGNDGIVVE